MFDTFDPRFYATVKVTLAFVKIQLSQGKSLSEIEDEIYASHNKDLKRIIDTLMPPPMPGGMRVHG